MQRDTAVDLLMGRLGRRTTSSLKDEIINEMVFMQENLLEGGKFLPWFLITSDDTLTSTSGDETITLPTDFIREWEDGGLLRETGDSDEPYKAITRDDYDIIKIKYPGSGTPKYYDRTETELLLRPTPDDTYTFKLWYYAKDASLAGTYGGTGSTTENGWLEHASDVLIAMTGVVVMRQYLNGDASKFVEQVAIAWDRLYARDTEWREANKERFMGDGL